MEYIAKADGGVDFSLLIDRFCRVTEIVFESVQDRCVCFFFHTVNAAVSEGFLNIQKKLCFSWLVFIKNKLK